MSDAPAPTPAPAAPPPAPLHREGFSRPETTLEKIGYAGTTCFGRLGIAVVLLLVIFGVLVGVPAWSVMTSPAYREAKRYIGDSDAVHMEVGEVVGFEKVPTRYRVEDTRAEFTFQVQGDIVAGMAHVSVVHSGGVWEVTSASFGVDPRRSRAPGVHPRKIVLLRGEPEPGPR